MLELLTSNDGESRALDRYIILDVYGSYWFYPSWTPQVDERQVSFTPWQTELLPVLDFNWPDGVGAADGIVFWAGYLEAGTFDLIGNVDSAEFSYR